MNREHISALMDGELDDVRAQTLCAQLKSDESCEWWATCHMIGDALRNECVAQSGFAHRFAERLASEPTVLAPGTRAPAHSRSPINWSEAYGARPWYYGMAAAAAVAAVGLVGWFGAQEFSLGPALSEQASAAPASLAAGGARMASIAVNAQSSAALSRKSQFPAMDPYLLVHQEYSPTTAMQGVRPYVRTVADATAAE